MTRQSLNLVCKATYVEEYLKELEAGKTENYARFFHAAIHSERDSHVHQALEMIRADIAFNEENKGELYYLLGIGLYRVGDCEGAKKALEICLMNDGTLWEARNLLENVELILCADEPKNTKSKSTLPKLVAVAGGLALGATCGWLGKSKLLKHVAFAGGLAGGAASTLIFSWEKLIMFAGGIQKAGELGESIEKMTLTYGTKAGLLTAGAVVLNLYVLEFISHWLKEVVFGLRSVDGYIMFSL